MTEFQIVKANPTVFDPALILHSENGTQARQIRLRDMRRGFSGVNRFNQVTCERTRGIAKFRMLKIHSSWRSRLFRPAVSPTLPVRRFISRDEEKELHMRSASKLLLWAVAVWG